LRSRASVVGGSPQTWEVFGKLQDLMLLLGGDDTQLLALEVGELSLKLENTLCRVIPALLERTGDQSIVGIFGDNAIGNGVVEQPEGQVHARMWRQRFSALPGALIHGIDAAIAGIAHTEPASTFGAQQQTL
jgi:hypothetical protein